MPVRQPGFRLYRLDAAAYKRVFAERRSFYGRSLTMWIGRSAYADRRVGVIVSKRTFRHAVDRNRAKRLLREAFRLNRASLADGLDMILIARAGIAGKRCNDVADDFRHVCRRARIWREEKQTQQQVMHD